LANTPEFAHAQRQRKKVEALFAELKNLIGLRRLRLRRLRFVREQFFLAAAAQNVKRLVRFLPTDNACSACHHLVELSEEKLDHATLAAEPTLRCPTFSTPTGHSTQSPFHAS
jgi:Transposase DDE domain